MLDHEVIGKFKEFQKKTRKYLDLDIEDVRFEKIDLFNEDKEYKSVFDIVRRGASPRPIKNFIVDKNSTEEKYNWLKIGDVTKSNIYLKTTSQYINKKGQEKSVLGKKGDFLLTNSMSVGIPIILDIDTCFHDGFLYLGFIDREQKNYYNLYLYYYFKSYRNKLIAKSNDGIVKNLNTEIIKVEIIPIPKALNEKYTSYKIQKIIVEFLEYGFDWLDGIKVNIDKQNDIYKRLRKALIPSTFKRDYIKIRFAKYVKKHDIDFNITDVEFEVNAFEDYLNVVKGGSIYTTKYLRNHTGNYPVYSSNTDKITKGIFGKIDTYDYDIESIQFTSNGEKAGTIFFLEKHKFSMNGDRGMFDLKMDNINMLYIYFNLKNEFRKHKFSWANKPSNTKIKSQIKIFIPKPLDNYTSFEIQKIIADFINEVDDEIQQSFNKIDKGYDAVKRYKRAYLYKTFSKIDWSKQ